MAYKGKNNMSARDVFNHRSLYNGFAFSEAGEINIAPESTKNFWFLENMHYGRIRDKSGEVSIITPKTEFLLSVGPTAANKKAGALDFVVDAYEVMKREYEKSRLQNKISSDSTYLSKLFVHKGAFSISDQQRKLRSSLSGRFVSYADAAKDKSNSVFSFEDFSPLFMEFLMAGLRNNPVTNSSYMISRQSSPMTSGLCLEVADLDHSRDEDKSKYFLDDPNFQIYKILAANSGFAIDKNAPWRLVADIASKKMLEFATKRVSSINTAEDVLDYYFEDMRTAKKSPVVVAETDFVTISIEYDVAAVPFIPTPAANTSREEMTSAAPELVYVNALKYDELDDLKRMMYGAYNALVLEKPSVSAKNVDSKRNVSTEIQKRTKETFNAINARMGNDFWYDKFVRIKNIELDLGYAETEIVKLVNSAVGLEKSFDRAKAMGYISKRMTPIISSEGSLSYETRRLGESSTTIKENAQSIVRGLNKKVY